MSERPTAMIFQGVSTSEAQLGHLCKSVTPNPALT